MPFLELWNFLVNYTGDFFPREPFSYYSRFCNLQLWLIWTVYNPYASSDVPYKGTFLDDWMWLCVIPNVTERHVESWIPIIEADSSKKQQWGIRWLLLQTGLSAFLQLLQMLMEENASFVFVWVLLVFFMREFRKECRQHSWQYKGWRSWAIVKDLKYPSLLQKSRIRRSIYGSPVHVTRWERLGNPLPSWLMAKGPSVYRMRIITEKGASVMLWFCFAFRKE